MKKLRWKSVATALLASVILAGSAASTRAMDMNDSDGSMMMDARAMNAQMLIKTLSEEKTEINALASQQAQFRKMGGETNNDIARMFGRWIREHKAGGPMFMKLTKQNGGDPMDAKVLKSPVLGDRDEMLTATHKDHEAAVMTSQMRYAKTGSAAIKMAMHKRANLARKHLRQMAPYLKMDRMAAMNCPMCNVKMEDGKCPMCGMTADQMKGDMKNHMAKHKM